mgnify:CR=1 FL=1
MTKIKSPNGPASETLRDLPVGMSATVNSVGGKGQLRQHFLDMGLIPGVRVTLVKYAPMGDPVEVRLHGYELTLRLEDAGKIGIRNISREGEPEHVETFDEEERQLELPHPGLGEEKGLIDDPEAHLRPVKGKLTFALAGNQNCGKTTLFNQLTGSNQHVGNFPGVTVDRKSGPIRGYPDTEVTDLPGIYSLSPYTSEEIVSREFILDERPSAIINIVDATNIERNLYLTMQLMELDIPMVLALNMMDEMEGNGGSIHINEMEQILQMPVVPISAVKNQGVEELVRHAVHIARYQERPGLQDFCGKNDHGGAVHRALHGVMHLIEDHAKAAAIPIRFAAAKLLEGDHLIQEELKLDPAEIETIDRIAQQMETERGLDRAAAIADMRYLFIDRLCRKTVVKPHESREHVRSRRIDRILTGKYTAIPAFILIMALVFWLTFNVIGAALQDWLADGIDALTEVVKTALASSGVNDAMQSLIVDGIFTGVGSVLSFIPIIVVLFFFLSLLEDSGYMARVAFFMDKLLRKIGLSGRSIVPMLIGFGCTVPAVMSTRTLPSERDRKMTIMLTPFMSCSAKLPIYALFTAAFFPRVWRAPVMIFLYLFGILCGILYSLILKQTCFRGEPVPFVMELPNYRLPSPKSVGQLIWEKARDFIQRAFTIIFVATVVIWFLQTFDTRLNVAATPDSSLLALVGSLITPIFKPLGFGDWRISTALITGFTAKESVVSTLTVLLGGDTGALNMLFTPFTALVFLIFTLLYTPCVAAIAAVKRELGGGRAALGVVLMQCGIAWVVAFAVHCVGVLLGLA